MTQPLGGALRHGKQDGGARVGGAAGPGAAGRCEDGSGWGNEGVLGRVGVLFARWCDHACCRRAVHSEKVKVVGFMCVSPQSKKISKSSFRFSNYVTECHVLT